MTAEPAALSNHLKGLVMVGLGVLALSPDAMVVRLLKMGSLAVVFWQGLLMTVGFSGLALLLYRREAPARIVSMGRWGLAVGVFSSLNNVLFVVSVTHTAVANTLVILAASPVLAAVLSSIFLGDRISPATWAACLLILAGVAAIVRSNPGGATLTGDLAAFGGSISTASMLVVLRRRPGSDPVPGMTIGGALAALVVIPGVGGFSLTARQLLLLLLLGLVLLPVALGLITRGPAYLTAPEVGLMTLLETGLGPLWVWLAVGEQPSRASVLSGATIVAVLAAHSILALRAETGIDRRGAPA